MSNIQEWHTVYWTSLILPHRARKNSADPIEYDVCKKCVGYENMCQIQSTISKNAILRILAL